MLECVEIRVGWVHFVCKREDEHEGFTCFMLDWGLGCACCIYSRSHIKGLWVELHQECTAQFKRSFKAWLAVEGSISLSFVVVCTL